MKSEEVALLSSGSSSKTVGWTSWLVFTCFCCTIGSSFIFGFNIGVVNVPQKHIKDFLTENYESRAGHVLSASATSWLLAAVVSVFTLGGMFGALIAEPMTRRLGARRALLWNQVITFASSALMMLCVKAARIELLIAGRFLVGVASGVMTSAGPLYLNEVSPLSVRGASGTVFQFMVVTGLVVSQILGLDFLMGTATLWPYLVGGSGVFGVLQLLLLPLCPDSPAYILSSGGPRDTAIRALTRLRQTIDVSDELQGISDELQNASDGQQMSWSEMWRLDVIRRPLLVCVVIHASQQLCGINAINFYSESLFEEAGLSHSASLYVSVSTGVVQLLMTLVSAVLVDRFGRRTLHVLGLAVMWVFSALLTTALLWQDHFPWTSYFSVVFVYLFLIGFATGPGSIPWFITAEMFPPEAKTRAVSVAVVVNWLANCSVGVAYPPLQEAIGAYSFLPFTVLLSLFILYLRARCPETKGRSIQQVQDFFRSRDAYGPISDVPDTVQRGLSDE